MRTHLIVITALLLGLPGCKGKEQKPAPAPATPPAAAAPAPAPTPAPTAAPAPAAQPESPEDLARAALGKLKKSLMSAMFKAKKEGMDQAIAVCKEAAPRLAKEASVGGLTLGRTSHKLRNKANAPRPWMEPLLAAYQKDPVKEPRIVKLKDGKFGYVEPIYTMKLCLKCHGAALEEDVKNKLAAAYPEDQATGFEAGQFRGLMWAEMDPE